MRSDQQGETLESIYVAAGNLLKIHRDEPISIAEYLVTEVIAGSFVTNAITVAFPAATLKETLPPKALLLLIRLPTGGFCSLGLDANRGIIQDTRENRKIIDDLPKLVAEYRRATLAEADAVGIVMQHLMANGESPDDLEIQAKRKGFCWIVHTFARPSTTTRLPLRSFLVNDQGQIFGTLVGH